MKPTNFKIAAGLIAALAVMNGSVPCALAQESQIFTVSVDPVLSIEGPDDTTINHDTTDSNQTFSTANWTVACNNQLGAIVDFTTSDVFRNGSVTRDLTMSLAVVSTDTDDTGDVWAVNPLLSSFSSVSLLGVPILTNGRVQALSSRPGNATLGLDMEFRDTNYALLPQGSYSVTVTGTITAN